MWKQNSLDSKLKSKLEKLHKQLAKVEQKLDKYRTACADLHGNGTMRKARNEINWDYYAQQKHKIKYEIEKTTQALCHHPSESIEYRGGYDVCSRCGMTWG